MAIQYEQLPKDVQRTISKKAKLRGQSNRVLVIRLAAEALSAVGTGNQPLAIQRKALRQALAWISRAPRHQQEGGDQ